MDILFVASWYPSKLNPELGNFVQRHAEAVASTGVTVKVIHIAFSNRILFPIREKENVQGIKIIHYFLPKIGSKSQFLTRYRSRILLKKINRDHFDPKVVHCHVAYPAGDFAIQIADYLKIPLVYTEHWSRISPAHPNSISTQIEKRIERVVNKSRFVLPVSQHLGELMRNRGFTGNYQVVNNTVDTKFFHPLPRKENKPSTFLHISNFAPGIKNTEGIILAFSKIKNTNSKLIIAGDGDLKRLRLYCKTQEIDTRHIRFLGKMTYREVAELNQQSDCFVLFSAFENSPSVIAEALCCGLPVIASKVGGIPEMIDDTNGRLVAQSDTQALTAAMEQMHSQIDFYNASEIAHKAQAQYGYASIGKKLVDIYLKTYHRSKSV